MIEFTFDYLVDKEFFDKLAVRGQRRILKAGYTETLKYWHKIIFPKHFERGNIGLYPSSFKQPKAGNVPLVDLGNFRKRMMEDKEIRATFKGATSKYNFGRPEGSEFYLGRFYKEFNQDIKAMLPRTRNTIFRSMKGKKITFEEAKKKIIAKKFARSSYNANTRARMAKGVAAFNDNDRNTLRNFMQKFVVSNMQPMGKANYKKLSIK